MTNEKMSTTKTGRAAEQAAARFLKENGMEIVAANYRSRMGEIDLIARDGKAYVFVEVKYRKSAAGTSPLEAVDLEKQGRIARSALCFLQEKRLPMETPCRFDVIGFEGDKLIYVRDAFSV